MEIQSLSIHVPGGCPNECKFCVARLHPSHYDNLIGIKDNRIFHYTNEYIARLNFARDNGCNTVILTGDCEPHLNEHFLSLFAGWNRSLQSPFRWIELQTSGIRLPDKLHFLRNVVNISTISLSLSSLKSDENIEYNGIHERDHFDIDKLCTHIKEAGFNLRISLNMTDVVCRWYPVDVFEKLYNLGADQVTLRKLYHSKSNETINEWINQHGATDIDIAPFKKYIRDEGVPLEVLSFGATRYAVNGMSVVLDDDCMSTEAKRSLKYLILRPNCRLYSHWDTPGSLIF